MREGRGLERMNEWGDMSINGFTGMNE